MDHREYMNLFPFEMKIDVMSLREVRRLLLTQDELLMQRLEAFLQELAWESEVVEEGSRRELKSLRTRTQAYSEQVRLDAQALPAGDSLSQFHEWLYRSMQRDDALLRDVQKKLSELVQAAKAGEDPKAKAVLDDTEPFLTPLRMLTYEHHMSLKNIFDQLLKRDELQNKPDIMGLMRMPDPA